MPRRRRRRHRGREKKKLQKLMHKKVSLTFSHLIKFAENGFRNFFKSSQFAFLVGAFRYRKRVFDYGCCKNAQFPVPSVRDIFLSTKLKYVNKWSEDVDGRPLK